MTTIERNEAESVPGLLEVLDQHAELRELVAQLRESADPVVLTGLLRRLTRLLEAHFAREEQSWAADGSRNPDVAADLMRDHADLLTRLRALVAGRGSTTEVAANRSEMEDLLARLERHDAREAEVFGSGLGLQPEVSSASPISSHALEVNLRRTAVEVVVPRGQQILLELTAGRYGVHESTRKLLREINHPYVNWEETLEELHHRAMNDLHHYLASERASEAIGVFSAFYIRAAQEGSGAQIQETAVRYQTYYWEKILRSSEDRLAALLPVLSRAMAQLEAVLRSGLKLGAVSSPRLNRVLGALLEATAEPAPPGLERAFSLLALSLGQSYARWLANEDAAAWWREVTGAGDARSLPDAVASISHERLRACLQTCEDLVRHDAPLRDRARLLVALPDYARIARGFLEAAAAAAAGDLRKPDLARTRWLVRMLSLEELGGVQEEALAEIARLHADVVAAPDPADFEAFVRETFGALRRFGFLTSPNALHLVAKLGAATLASGDPDRAHVVIDEMLGSGFPRPNFTGFGEEWQVRSDPAHLAALRAYLEVIEANPLLAQPLIAGLVVQLSIGGVLVTDMDLFQKDVSRLLNSGVEPVYHTVIHLLRLLPVYYADIGAEGELRDVSSRIDEIDARQDPLCHFLRKQCHVESSPLLLDFVEAVARFWKSGDPETLRSFVPRSLYERVVAETPVHAAPGAVVREVLSGAGASSLFDVEPAELSSRLAASRSGEPLQREKVALLAVLRRLLARKYELGHVDLLERLESWHDADKVRLQSLRRALDRGDDENALVALISILEDLQQVVLSERPTEGLEDIYRKRHIAVGIPSLYGRYREAKLEAVGLGFRVGSLANVLFERLASHPDLACPTHSTLRQVARWLHLFLRVVRVEGCKGRGLATGIRTLERSLEDADTSVEQYVNIFQLLSRGVAQLIRIRFRDVYEDVLERLVRQMIERGEIALERDSHAEETILEISEHFLRDRIGESLGLQPLDRMLGRVLQALLEVREKLDREIADRLISFDLDRASLTIDRHPSSLDGPVHLGNKGYQIRRLAQEGLPVPPGFVMTKELFRCRDAVRVWPALQERVAEHIRRRVRRLERRTGARFGNARRPLLLAVRSSSALSMPGVLDTFLNVGMDPTLAEKFAAHSGSAWGAWDAYRRFVQSWGMAYGLERDTFDAIMSEAKARVGVRKKAELPPTRMKALALRYRSFVQDHGVELVDEPLPQLLACVDLVLRSWDSERARIYRNEVGVAEEWGTAVIVQSMVYGNLDQHSGTGVAMTCDPRREGRDVKLYGDFMVQAQGDDIVGGLVETFPIRRDQRGSETTERSLETGFPRIYRALQGHAEHLVQDLGMFHQEIEFTFESDDPEDLYILQTRDTVMSQIAEVTAFVAGEALEKARLATGVGAGGGALSGRVAHSREQIAALRERFPEDRIVLLRPDTVPDDIPLIVQVDGMVTARGGATSHAALVAQRLGRSCVVGCAGLEVDENRGCSTLGGRELAAGDYLSINGLDGSVYWGVHPTTTLRRQRLA